MRVLVLGSHGFPEGTEYNPAVRAHMEDTEPKILQAVADDMQRHVDSFGPVGLIALNDSGNLLNLDLERANPYWSLADATHHSITHSIQDAVEGLQEEGLQGLSPEDEEFVFSHVAERMYINTLPGVYITSSLLQVVPEVFAKQFPDCAPDPARLGRIAKNSVVLGALLAARNKHGGVALIDELSGGDSGRLNQRSFHFDPDMFEVVSVGDGKHEVVRALLSEEDLAIGRPAKGEKLAKRKVCPALEVMPVGGDYNLLRTMWDAMSAIVERHHYQADQQEKPFPELGIGRITLFAARKMGPHQSWPRV